jgi:protein CpxP
MPYYSRSIAILALAGATMLATPMIVMAADGAPPAATQPGQAAVATNAAPTPEAPRETVEQRITNLHASLQITPGEETKWNGVTRAMRGSASVMDRLIAEKSAKDPATLTAVDDLRAYQKIAHAHTEGLKDLTASFEILYKAMPDAQKKVADQVFRDSGRRVGGSHS